MQIEEPSEGGKEATPVESTYKACDSIGVGNTATSRHEGKLGVRGCWQQ
jgi:hypothetical protein